MLFLDVMNTEEKFVQDIIVLTDGGVEDTDEIISLCRKNKDKNRVWGIGIGPDCSTGETYTFFYEET